MPFHWRTFMSIRSGLCRILSRRGELPFCFFILPGGMRLAGLSPDGHLVEIVELPDHPWFVGAQFHPEFKSRPDRPHPLFYGFVKASVENAEADAQ